MTAEEDKARKGDGGTRSGSWSGIIEAVKTPLGILALVLLICLSMVSAASVRLPSTELPKLVWAVFILVFSIFVVVGFICLRNPHFLLGVLEKESPEFRSCKAELIQSKARVAELEQKTEELRASLTTSKAQVDNLHEANHDLRAIVEEQSSLKRRVWALCNQAGSVNIPSILDGLGRNFDATTKNEVLSVLGELVDEGKIEGDDLRPQGYYRLKAK